MALVGINRDPTGHCRPLGWPLAVALTDCPCHRSTLGARVYAEEDSHVCARTWSAHSLLGGARRQPCSVLGVGLSTAPEPPAVPIVLSSSSPRNHLRSRAAPSSWVNTCPVSAQALARSCGPAIRRAAWAVRTATAPPCDVPVPSAMQPTLEASQSRVQWSMGKRPEVWARRPRDVIFSWIRSADPRLHDQRCGDRSQTPQHVVDREGGCTHAQQGSALRRGPALATTHFSSTR
jgi:hypothetical protein